MMLGDTMLVRFEPRYKSGIKYWECIIENPSEYTEVINAFKRIARIDLKEPRTLHLNIRCSRKQCIIKVFAYNLHEEDDVTQDDLDELILRLRKEIKNPTILEYEV